MEKQMNRANQFVQNEHGRGNSLQVNPQLQSYDGIQNNRKEQTRANRQNTGSLGVPTANGGFFSVKIKEQVILDSRQLQAQKQDYGLNYPPRTGSGTGNRRAHLKSNFLPENQGSGFATIDHRQRIKLTKENAEFYMRQSLGSQENILKIPTHNLNIVDPLPTVKHGQRNKTVSKTQGSSKIKSLGSQGLAHYPSQSKLQEPEQSVQFRNKSDGLVRIAIPQTRAYSIQQWNKRHPQNPPAQQIKTNEFNLNPSNPQSVKTKKSNQYVLPLSNLDQKSKPYNFLANMWGKETSSNKLMLNTAPYPIKMIQHDQVQSTKSKAEDNLVVFTDMNVDHHDYEIRNRRVLLDQQKLQALSKIQSSHQQSEAQLETVQMLSNRMKPSTKRPISGVSSSYLEKQQKQFSLQKNEAQGSKHRLKTLSQDMNLLQESEFAQSQRWRIEEVDEGNDNMSKGTTTLEDTLSIKSNQVGIFCKQLMQARPTTALVGNAEQEDQLPYPELFDRSERTFAATFARYGDLSYFTPVQRIGNYMEYQARLKKRHLMDLIAYLKTSKCQVKVDEEGEAGNGKNTQDFLDHCLFRGLMINEEPISTQINAIMDHQIPEITVQQRKLLQRQAYDPCNSRNMLGLTIQKIWSKPLLKQLQMSIHRMLRYIDGIDCIRDEELSKFKSEWILHALELIPQFFQKNFKKNIQDLYKELQLSYKRSMKQAIMDYILRSPDERKRLHILMLPQHVITAAERQVQQGGYSIGLYQGTHHRKIQAENEIKFRLITNNIVVSSLQNWWQEFRNFKLVDLQNFQTIVQERNLTNSLTQMTGAERFEPEISNTLDIDNFLSFQEAVLEKTKAIFKYIWHRGAILIVKKFKYLKTKQQQRLLCPGNAAKSRWTYSGYVTEPQDFGFDFESPMHDKVEHTINQIRNFTYIGGEQSLKMDNYQQYALRTASAHKNVNLKYFRTEKEHELKATIEDLLDSTDIKDLVDIRESPAYIQFVSMIGTFINYDENGYEGLAKDYKRELKYAAGNLMLLQMRELLENSVSTFVNFFKGFKTYQELKFSVPNFKPMREIKPLSTRFVTEQERKLKLLEEQEKELKKKTGKDNVNVHLQAQLKQRKQNSISGGSEIDQTTMHVQKKDTVLNLPDFIHLQDYANPIFHLELLLGSMQDLSEFQNDGNMLKLTQNLEFNKSDQQILDHFQAFYLDLCLCFDDFARPEFCKIRLFDKRYQQLEQQETEHTRKIQLEEQRKSRRRAQSDLPKESLTIKEAKNKQIFHYSLIPLITPPTIDFDKIMYNGLFENPLAYEKYMGRIKVKEVPGEVVVKNIVPENQVSDCVFLKDQVKRNFNVAQTQKNLNREEIILDTFFKEQKDTLLETLRDHLRETKRIHELYEQFKPIIQGKMQERVMNFINSPSEVLSQTKEYAAFLDELKNFKNLALQLPYRVSFPLFEVGLRIVNKEILNRIENFIFTVLSSFEEALRVNTAELCSNYEVILERIGKTLTTAEEVVAMDNYKNRLLMDMATLQRKLAFNRKCVYFMLTQNCHEQVFVDPKEENGKIIEGECKKLVIELHYWPQRLNDFMDECDERHADQRLIIEKEIQTKKSQLEKNVKAFADIMKKISGIHSIQGFRKTIEFIKEAKANLDKLEELKQQILVEETLLFGYRSDFHSLASMIRSFEPYYELWIKIDYMMNKRIEWMDANLSQIDAEEVEVLIKETMRALPKLQKQFNSSNSNAHTILAHMQEQLKKLSEIRPVVEVLCSKALKTRHWQQIKLITGSTNENFQELTLKEVMTLSVHDEENLKLLKENIDKAKKQDRLENMLSSMKQDWQHITFELIRFKDTDIQILQGANIEIMQNKLDEHVLQSQMIKNNPDVEPLIIAATEWEHVMVYTQDVLDLWLRVQTNYLFLFPIFNAGGIQDEVKSLLDQESFRVIDAQWRKIMEELKVKNRVLDLEKEFPNLLDDLRYQDEQLTKIQSSLNAYLESKREYFPRFFFLPNEDLIEILGDALKPKRIQKHLKKCFEGINEISFRDAIKTEGKIKEQSLKEQIWQIESREGEKVQLLVPIFPHDYDGQVEQWLFELEKQMRLSVQKVISDSIKDYPSEEPQTNIQGNDQRAFGRQTFKKYNSELANWLTRWQSQVLIVVQQIIWTANVEAALQSTDSYRQLVKLYQNRQNQLVMIVSMVRDKLPELLRLTLSSLIVIEVHARDIVESLARSRTSSVDDFNWINNMRYYFDKTNETVQVSMIMTDLTYNNEFLGNTGRLVITPLTDRCYRTLMSALVLNLGGAPEGPAGTGKTETTKDLAKAVAIHCMVFNCGEGLNAKFMSKFFKGLASGGSWSCFDEFNRIDLEVLSVIAQQILEIQRAKGQKLTEFIFEDALIKLKPNCNIFITMNPDYAGRSQLPDNLKALFRPVAMMIPEYSMISEISLYSFGFIDSRVLAKKIVQTYRLCSEQLSSQYHYDYGMRAVKAVLTAAKNLKYQQARKQAKLGRNSFQSLNDGKNSASNSSVSSTHIEDSEEVIILRSIRDVNLPKFLAEDIPLFDGIIHDLFQGLEITQTDYPPLRNSLYKAFIDLNLQSSPQFIEKIFQLYDMIKCRHGLMIVGPANSGKTSICTSLRKALNYVAVEDPTFEELAVEPYVINPKSVTIEQLYGQYDQISQEFADGIIGSLFRRCAYKNKDGKRQWIIFDGPVDANWIENMNTVLDDNKRLCLANGEVIQMTDKMNMIFETHDLSFASPATVSRCGMVFCPQETYGGWMSLLQSWLNIFEQKAKLTSMQSMAPADLFTHINNLFKLIYGPLLAGVLSQCKLIIPVSDTQITSSMLKLMDILTSQDSFIRRLHDENIKVDEILQRVDMIFQFSIIQSLGVITDEPGQAIFQQRFKAKVSENFKISSKQFRIERSSLITHQTLPVFNFIIDDLLWISWKDLAAKPENNPEIYDETPINEIIVTTTENLKQTNMLNLLIKEGKPVVFIGNTGTGKTIAIQRFLRSLDQSAYDSATICFSAKSTANFTQESIKAKLDKRGRRILGPPSQKKFVFFIDDLNMPTIEKNGAQPPIELLRQWMDHKSWYDYSEKNNALLRIQNIVFAAAMCPHDGGKNLITPRFSRHFNIIACTQFDESVLNRIYTKIIDWHISKEKIRGTKSAQALKGIVEATIDIFTFVQTNLKPTPAKSHYLFNLRDISRVIQGVHMMRNFTHSKLDKLVRLWVHEIARVFTDRLTCEDDQMKVFQRLFFASRQFIKEDLATALRDFQSNEDKENGEHIEKQFEIMTKSIKFTDIMDSARDINQRQYDEVRGPKVADLQAKLFDSLRNFNSISKKPMDLVLFDFAVTHILRITRVLKISKGNILLIGLGGSGRRSLSILSAYLMDQEIFTPAQTKNYKYDDWVAEIKDLMMRAGLESLNSAFLLTDDNMKHNYVLQDVNNLLNQYDIPNIFGKEDKITIIEQSRMNARNEGRIDLYNSQSPHQLMDFFTSKVEKHLNVILCMSPTGSTLQERIRMFPSLVNCCTINWFTDWPQDALAAVAMKFLDETPFDDEQKNQIRIVCTIFHTDSQQMSKNYLREMKRHTYITPTTYLDLMQIFIELLEKQRNKLFEKKNSYETGVKKLTETQESVMQMQIELNEKQPMLETLQIEASKLEEQVTRESEDVVEPQKKLISQQERAAHEIAMEAEAIKIECENELQKALPIMKQAQAALDTIKPKDINEIKALQNPPLAIRTTMHAVCVMMERKVEKTPRKDNPKIIEDNWWFTAQRFMSEKSFLDELLNIDKDNIPEAVIEKIRNQFLNDPEFKPSRVAQASKAAKGLCDWIIKLEQYHTLVVYIRPKKQALMDSKQRFKVAEDSLAIKQTELKKIVMQYESLQLQLTTIADQKKQLSDDINDCSIRLLRAKLLMEGLGGEEERWKESLAVVKLGLRTIIPDVLLGAVIIAYLGPFTQMYRKQATTQWIKLMKSYQFKLSPNYSLEKVLGEQVVIKQWQKTGLPNDEFSVENGIILTNTIKWPLMIDPQGQANKWIKNMEQKLSQEINFGTKLLVVKPSDPDLSNKFNQALRMGLAIVLESVEETVDPLLEPVLLKQVFKVAGIKQINFGDEQIDYADEFRLYMTTKFENPHYLPELTTKVTIINFMITYEILCDQLLNLVVKMEKESLDDERVKLIQQQYENNKQMDDIEQTILSVLKSSQGNILDDEKAIDILRASQQLSEEIKKRQVEAEKTQVIVNECRKMYFPIAKHASMLFFLGSKLSQVDVMYQYSLSWFIQLFTMAVTNSKQTQSLPDEQMISTRGKTLGNKQMDERVGQLVDYFTFSFYSNVCRSLFEKDKLLFSFLLTAQIRLLSGKLNQVQYSLLIKNFTGLENPQKLYNPCYNWLPLATWNNLCMCQQEDPLFDGLIKNFEKYQEHWRELFDCEQLEDELFPPNDTSISKEWPSFMKLVIVKCFRPDKLPHAMQQYVHSEMGKRFLSPPIFDIEQSYSDSNNTTPLIFILPGTDPLQQLTQFATLKKKIETMKVISLGQGQGPKAERCITDAKKHGSWVLLQNCHLYPSWMGRLNQICEQMETKQGIFGQQTHPGFRLWLTSYPSSDFPITILQNGIKMTNEPPIGLKSNMIGNYKTEPLNDQNFFEGSKNPAVFKKLAFGLAMFHAILLQRRNFGSLGWNIQYEFTVSDLQISLQQLNYFIEHYQQVPFVALKYLIGECNYGGRVTSLQDNRVITALLEDLLDEKVLEHGYSVLPFGQSYMMPSGDNPFHTYIEKINSMPTSEIPQLFGFHPNADISKNQNQAKTLLETLLSIGEVEGAQAEEDDDDDKDKRDAQTTRSYFSGGMSKNKSVFVQSQEDQTAKTCLKIIEQLPKYQFDLLSITIQFPIMRENSMNTVLMQEVNRFNRLYNLILNTLDHILLAQKGDILMTDDLNQAQEQIFKGFVPELWKKISYPSLKPLASYIVDLTLRMKTLQNWIMTLKPPEVFWLSGFYFTQSFLTAILQNYARKHHIEIDLLEFEFKFMDKYDPTDHQKEIFELERVKKLGFDIPEPTDGALISGLYFEGAKWDFPNKCISEQTPKQLFSQVPVIWLHPNMITIVDPTTLKSNETQEFSTVSGPKLGQRNTAELRMVQTNQKSSMNVNEKVYKTDSNSNVHVRDEDKPSNTIARKAEATRLDENKIYKCPLYKTHNRKGTLSTTGHSTNFIFYVDVPIVPELIHLEKKPTEDRRQLRRSTTILANTFDSHNINYQHWVKRGTAILCSLPN